MIQKIITALSVLLALVLAPVATNADLSSVAEGMDNYLIPAAPPVYGEIIERLPKEVVGDIPKVLKALEIFGYLETMGDVANKLDAGDKSGAAIDLAMGAANLALNLTRDATTRQVLVAGVGISTIPLTALITTIDITMQSYDAVAASKTALELERLYYTIAADPVLKATGRKLGEGDPIRIDQTTIEHLWRRVIFNDEWRALFRTYVTTELGEEWPEPSLWQRLTIQSDHLDEAMLFEEAKRLKGHIASLLRELNNVAKAEEARVVLARELKALAAMGAKLSPEELVRALEAHGKAVRELPKREAYVKDLPGRIENFKESMGKAGVEDLLKIREAISGEMGAITENATVIRGLVAGGRYGAIRETLLKSLQSSFRALVALRAASGQAEVNTRLVAETKKLEVAGTEFVVTRHTGKVFEDVQQIFAALVIRGEAGAQEAVQRARAEIQKSLDELIAAYQKDRVEQDAKYREKMSEFSAALKRLQDEVARTTDSRQYSSLWAAIDRLRAQMSDLERRYTAYVRLYTLTRTADEASSRGALAEIDTFVRANANRQGIVQARIEAAYRDANAKYTQFYQNTQSLQRQIRSEQDLADIERLLKEAADSYAGLSFDFLKPHLKNDPESSRAKNVLDTITQMTGALRTYFDSLPRYRLPWYTNWEKSTIPSLRFMASSEARDAVQVVLNAIETALTIMGQTDPEDFSVTFRQTFDARRHQLLDMQQSTQAILPLLARASGLPDRLERYADRALRNNALIAEDSARVLTVLRAFQRASGSLQTLYASFLMDSQYYTHRTIASGQVLKVIEDTRVGFWDKTLELGIAEALLKEPFVTIRSKDRVMDILPEDIRAARQMVASAPIAELPAFFGHFGKARNEGTPMGAILDIMFMRAHEFPQLFQGESKHLAETKELMSLYSERRNSANQNQQRIDERNARANLVLMRANQFLQSIRQRFDAGDYRAAASYEMFLGDVRWEYENLKDRRNDIDQAFGEIDRLITAAKQRQAEAALAQTKDIQNFYAAFRQAYESRNDSQVMSMIADNWESGDGTTLADMQSNLRRSFRTFDEIRVQIQNLQIQPQGQSRFIVSYELTLSSRIIRRNIRHQEKSFVREEVVLDERGRPRISRTMTGQFWFTN